MKKLVGFARAIGDTALVATVHDVVVHPELRSLGLGRMLVRRLVGQVMIIIAEIVTATSVGNISVLHQIMTIDLANNQVFKLVISCIFII